MIVSDMKEPSPSSGWRDKARHCRAQADRLRELSSELVTDGARTAHAERAYLFYAMAAFAERAATECPMDRLLERSLP